MKRFIREPLVHFILLAVAIFGLYQLISSNRQGAERTIVITAADMERLASLYAVEAGALPTEQDMRAILTDQVQQEALAREARRLGMAEDDTVVQRRLAQKMIFMLSDIEQVPTPSDEVLQAWLTDHAERFEIPQRISFDHVYFSDVNDPRLLDSAQSLNADREADWRGFGDPFMLQRRYGNLPLREIVRLFGSEFAEEIVALADADLEEWHGPLNSALGSHLVRITQSTKARLPGLNEIRGTVLQDWRDHEQRRRTAEEVAAIVGRYTIVVEGATKP